MRFIAFKGKELRLNLLRGVSSVTKHLMIIAIRGAAAEQPMCATALTQLRALASLMGGSHFTAQDVRLRCIQRRSLLQRDATFKQTWSRI